MDDKSKKTNDPFEPESHSAFSRRDKTPATPPVSGEKPIPSQPRSFSPVRPQRTAVPRKGLANPEEPAAPVSTPAKTATTASPAVAAPSPSPASPAAKASAAPEAPATPLKSTGTSADINSTKSSSGTPASTSSFKRAAASTVPAAPLTNKSVQPDQPGTPATALPAAAATASVAPPAASAAAATTAAPQSSGAGGDTIRLRVQPRPHARTLNTAPGRGLRRRLPDIRQGKLGSTAASYGPFAMLFGFLWLMFKMVFFTALVLGLGALIGFMAMTEYIKTPEVTVPNVSGMKIDEAFEVLSDKGLGVIKLRTESSGLVAPGEIISQQPPAGASAKDKTDVGVVISSGRSQYVVPNVVNETRENAENKIRGARLEVGNVLPLEDNSVPRGNVISQTPIGGTGSDEPVKVDLMVSAGPPGKSLTMPDLSGRTVLEAKAALKAVGVDDVVTEPADAPPDAKVLSHTPLVGKTVFQTDKVTLLTGKK